MLFIERGERRTGGLMISNQGLLATGGGGRGMSSDGGDERFKIFRWKTFDPLGDSHGVSFEVAEMPGG